MMSHSPFHAGERAMQARAGVSAMAKRVGNGIHESLPPAAQDFLEAQPMVFIGATDAQGRVWASALTGAPGFAMALTDEVVRIDALPAIDDPLYATLVQADGATEMGMLAIDPATRKRMRVNGIVSAQADRLFLQARQVYANCPKYIQARVLDTRPPAASTDRRTVVSGNRLNAEQRGWIERADTFFIASVHREGGADVSHRGGQPGFIAVPDETTLVFPDYAGNMMFNTLGNLMADARAGLLFVDFETRTMLQTTGMAEVIWEVERIAAFPGAERIVEFHIAEIVERPQAFPFRGHLLSYSPFNPR